MNGILDTRDLADELYALLDEHTEDDANRLTALRELRAELLGYGWSNGIVLIPEDEFVDYARQFAEDTGIVSTDSWPLNCIDWEQAADELAQDYSIVEFDGLEYYWQPA